MRSQQRTLTASHVCDEDVGVGALSLLLRIDDQLAIFRPDGSGIQLVFGRARGQVLHLPHDHVIDIDFEHGRRLGLDHVGEITSVRRPGGTLFRNLARLSEVHYLSSLGRDQKNIPLLVAVVVRLIGDPLAIRRPRRRSLAPVADGKLHRPATFRGDKPQIVSPADVRDESDGLAIRRPGCAADGARHVELLNGEALLHLRVGLAGDLLGISNSLRRRQSLCNSKSGHSNHDNKWNEMTHAYPCVSFGLIENSVLKLPRRILVNLHRAPGLVRGVAEILQRTIRTLGRARHAQLAPMPDKLVRK